jgi:RNA polymerase sigma-70 factor (ECF subfamily)
VQCIIEELRLNGHRALEVVYHDHRDEFVQWASHHYRCSNDEAREIFQQTVIVLFENVMTGKLKSLTSSLKTYLFSIGKNKIMELKRYNDKFVQREEIDIRKDDEPVYDEYLLMAAKESVQQMGQPCRGLLIDFYYNGKTMTQLALEYGYKNEDTAKSQKYRCLQVLRKIFQQRRKNIEA